MNREEIQKKLRELARADGFRPEGVDALAARLHVPPDERQKFRRIVREMEEQNGVRLTASAQPKNRGKAVPRLKARIVSIVKNGAFAALEDESEVFIQKSRLAGALPTDEVAVRILHRTGRLPEAEVLKILERHFSEFTGTFGKNGKRYFVKPDSLLKDSIPVTHKGAGDAQDGDKVFARIKDYGGRGQPPMAEIVTAYGSAESGRACCQAVLDRKHVRRQFPAEVQAEAEGLPQSLDAEGADRLDLRGEPIFTIDGAHTKDIDDAVSVQRLPDGYRLGVHIADVSHYVRPGTELDKEAFERGTSIYFGDTVIPMLPRELSNGICSLNPQEDRFALSAQMDIGPDGIVRDYTIHKSIIRSRVKGVYDEVNRLFAGEDDPELREKYREVLPSFPAMQELQAVLSKARERRGAIDFESDDCEILFDEHGVAVDVRLRQRGESEQMIEEFMLMANEAVAKYGSTHKIPFVYRVHEQPEADRLENLATALKAAGVDARTIRPGLKPLDVAAVLRQVADSPQAKALNEMVLRTMAKARYSPENLGHFGLALENYCHFTSPIRRYPDLCVHRILSDMLASGAGDEVAARYHDFVEEAATQSSQREIAAMQVEWDCDDIYKAEYMSHHIGEHFDAVVTGVQNYGMYVALPNTVEGLVRVESLPGGWYDYDEKSMTLSCSRSGTRYAIGDKVRVIVAGAEVAAGQVDFELI